MPSLLSTVRDIERLRQIILVLMRHGFGEFVQRAGLTRFLKSQDGDAAAPGAEASVESKALSAGPISFGARLRLVLQDLGPSFVKLGQIMSTRPDVLPADIVRELKALQDRVAPVSFDDVRGVVEEELGASIEDIFIEFDHTPMASASIAQVHRAKLKQGEEIAEIVVKVQRPRIRSTIERDIELLYLLARALERSVPESRVYSPVGLVSEFDRAISAELDFTREADNAERFARTFEGDPTTRFPRVYRQASARLVLALEYLPGLKVNDALRAGYSGESLAKIALASLFKQIYEHGFFHGDPHPGNLLVLGTPEAPVVGMIDLGLVGRLSQELRDKTVDLMVAAIRQDAKGVADALYAIGTPTKKINRRQYDTEVTLLAEKYLGKTVKEIEMSALIRDLIYGAVKYGLEIPPEFLMLGRTLMTVEGVGKELYPDLDVFNESRPYFMKLLWRRYSPERLGSDALRLVTRISGTASGLPEKLDEILDDLRRGTLTFKTNDLGLQVAGDLLGRRIFSGLTVAALIGGGSHLLASRSAEPFGYAMLGAALVWVLGHAGRMAWAGRALKKRL